MAEQTLKHRTRKLFFGREPESILFNRLLLALNILAVFLFLLEPVFGRTVMVRAVEVTFGLLFLAEYVARFWIAPSRISWFFEYLSLLDLIVILSLFAPLLAGDFAFLRVIRSLRILRTYRALSSLRGEKNWFTRNEDAVLSFMNLFVFVFVMTDIVYVMEVDTNESINSYVDALYFTLTTLTTTGFGDITLRGTTGKILAILIMVFGITLFVKLARDIIRPAKVHYKCPDCGLTRHDYDAAHCKHCGRTIKIEVEGF